MYFVSLEAPNDLRYPRWGGDGEAIQLEKSGSIFAVR